MAERRSAAQRRTTKGSSGRVTPKKAVGTPTHAPTASATSSGRYTPPIPREQKVSPPWVPVLMFALLGLGVAVIVLNYLGVLPGDTKNWYLVLGLGLITAGFVTATNYH
jgi:hypothetical protein